jgi:hypothetical protein
MARVLEETWRQLATRLGVSIVDQSPALELLLHSDGSIAGAHGIHRQKNEAWIVRAAGVVLATGGCAFYSHLLGSRTKTGDGYLMAAEAGAELSGMEFTSRHMLQGPVYCDLRRMPQDIRARLPYISPNVMLPFVRRDSIESVQASAASRTTAGASGPYTRTIRISIGIWRRCSAALA